MTTKSDLNSAKLDIKQIVAGELLTIADELNEESMMTIQKLVLLQSEKIEKNLTDLVNKRYDELAAMLGKRAEEAITNQVNKMSTDLRIRVKK